MMLDEEARSNEMARIQPPKPPMPPSVGGPARVAEEAQEGEPPAEANEAPEQEAVEDGRAAPRPATPTERKMLEKVMQQAITFLTSPPSVEYLIAGSQSESPEKVLAESVQRVIKGVGQAAAAGGVQLPPPVLGVATKTAIVTLAALMVKGGLAEDAGKLARGAMALIAAQGQQQPQQPPMEAANVPA